MKKFLTIIELKALLGVSSLVLGWSQRGKLVLRTTDGGTSFKVQQDLDEKKPMAFMYDKAGDINEGCLVNVDRSIKPLLVSVMATL